MKGNENNIGLKKAKPAVCRFYTSGFPVGFDIIRQEKGTSFTYSEKDNRLLFMLEGEITLDFNEYKDCIIKAGEMFYLPALAHFRGAILSTAKFIIFKNNDVTLPCTDDATYRLCGKKKSVTFDGKGTPIKEEIRLWLDQLIHYYHTGLSCNHIMVIKKQELYLLLKHYYTDEEKIRMFYLSLGENLVFREAVQQNYMRVKTAEELAALLGYGIKTFRKLFKENFDETPFRWMQRQTVLHIRSMLMKKDIPLKQIMFEHKFTSSSHFFHYCQKHFKATPTQIRNGESPSLPSPE